MKRRLTFVIFLFLTTGGYAQVAEKLLGIGMENIRTVEAGGNCIATFENNIYRSTYQGIGKAITAALEGIEQGGLELIVLRNGIPRLSIQLPDSLIRAYKGNKIPLAEVYARMSISCNTAPAMKWLKGSPNVINRSGWKPDLVVYPQVKLENSSFDVLYTYAINLSPALEMALWKGAALTAQAEIPIATNLKGEYRRIHPGIITLAQSVRFSGHFSGRLVAGNFTNHRLGGQAEIIFRNSKGWLELAALAGMTVQSLTDRDGWYVSTQQRFNAALKASAYEPRLNLQLDLQANRYIYGDYGLRGDLTRHFGEYAIGFYAMYTEGEINGGFHFAIPLPGKKWKRHQGFRIKPANYFAAQYNMVSWGEYVDRQMGESYETRPGANRSEHYFQPEYIRYFLIKETTQNPITN